MFKCRDCGCEFEEPKAYEENHGEGLWETMHACPNCGSNDYVEERACEICGEKHFNDSNYCEWCLSDAISMIRIDFSHFTGAKVMDLVDLFTEAIDAIYVDEKLKERSGK